ncbi:MAG: integron integrase [Candidatus Eisenbacteria sp.]|nr:integron integrase [Candidatus Eisenbacteria bacterium]
MVKELQSASESPPSPGGPDALFLADPPLRKPKPRKLIQRVRDTFRARHYAYSTEQAYVGWIKRYIAFHGMEHPARLNAEHVREFLTYLAVDRGVSVSTQSQANSGLRFLYKQVLGVELGPLPDVERSRKPKTLPIVLSKDEVRTVLRRLQGTPLLMASLLYGSGLRLSECMTLRVKDLDFESRQLWVRGGKGAKDRWTLLPKSVVSPLRAQMERVRELWDSDRKQRVSASLPRGITRKYANAGSEWGWQYVFPASRLWSNAETGQRLRHRQHESVLQRAVKEAVRKSGIAKQASCHTFRHSFATHLLEAGYSIRVIQKLLGHEDIRTTMQYTHVAGSAADGVRSPIDML